MYTPVPCTTRKLSEPVTVEGVTFPVGSVIDLHPHLMHHNPSVWEDHMVSKNIIERWIEISNNLTRVDSDEPLQPPVKLRNSKWCSVSSLTIIEYSSD